MKTNYQQSSLSVFDSLSKKSYYFQDVSCKDVFAAPTTPDSEFLTAIAHELKTPLAAIISFAETLQEEIRRPELLEDCQNYAKEISAAALDLNELVHDLLDVGQVASGNFSVDLSKELDVAQIIARSVKLNWDYALRRRISLVTEVVEDSTADSMANPLAIKLDAKRMKQILVNLISNAVKYSSEGSKVKIITKNLWENGKKFLMITVADNGLGMSNGQVANIFNKYYTAPNANSSKVDSFGLGLAITKQLVESQRGTISVNSQLNKGTEFILKFPY